MRFRWMWPWAALCLYALPGFGQDRVLTIEEALALARGQAADVVLARGRVEEARARQAQAARRFQDDPELEVGGGRRIHVPKSLKGVAVFSFRKLLGEPRGAADHEPAKP